MSTYSERFWHFLDVTSPRTLLTTQSQVDAAKEVVRTQPSSTSAHIEAKKLLECVVHPDTGDMIPAPFRFSAFVPMNFGIIYGMLHPTQQVPHLAMFWQILNQTYNVALNYSNRNASSTSLSNEDLIKSYLLAVGVSCGISLTGNKLLARSSNQMLKIFVPYFAVASAAVANVSAMRYSEYRDGVSLTDAEGNVVAGGALSQVAGQRGLTQVAISRVLIPIPIIAGPGLLMALLQKSVLRNGSKFATTMSSFAVLWGCLMLGTPACVAVFPQVGEINVNELEKPFQGLVDKNGQNITKLYYNKGL